MNLSKITEFYPWAQSERSLRGQCVLCLDRRSGSGEFAFVYLLLRLVRQGVAVKLVCSNHSRIHYVSLFRKNVSPLPSPLPSLSLIAQSHPPTHPPSLSFLRMNRTWT
jgi:hypothetical protein